jgi:hypothetical protein
VFLPWLFDVGVTIAIYDKNMRPAQVWLKQAILRILPLL